MPRFYSDLVRFCAGNPLCLRASVGLLQQLCVHANWSLIDPATLAVSIGNVDPLR